MEQKKHSHAGNGQGRGQRLYRWFNRRTGLTGVLHASLDEPVPGGARLAYVFGSGLIFIFISQIITGICLALYYVPSAESAHTSVAYITKRVAAGAFLRSLHSYGSSAMIIVLALHFLQTFLYGSYKGRRELLWMSGAFLSLLVLGMGFTGYLLPWDQKAYFATAVGTNIVGEVPLVGGWLTRLLRGGDTLGTLTLSRFYVAHVFLIPAMIFGFIAVHIALFRKAGPAGPINEDPVSPKLPPEGFFPRQVLMDMAFALLLVAGLGVFAYFRPVLLGPIANPANTQFLPRPEWYYLPMFEWLKFWEGPEVVFAIVVVPGVLALLFFLLPFLDRGLERRPWRRPIPVLSVAIVLTGTMYLGIRSHLDDMHDPAIAAQLARQQAEEKAYSEAPFQPELAAPPANAILASAAATGPVDPRVAQGKGLFQDNGCSGCHGPDGTGTAAAPSLVGITARIPADQLVALLHNPNAQMRAGGMPAVDLDASDMSALLAYLRALGTSAANVHATHGSPVPGATIHRAAAQPAPAVMTPVKSPAGQLASPQQTAAIAAGRNLFQSHACFACHGQNASGGRAPALAPLVAQLSDTQLAALLQLPTPKMRAGGMAPFSGTQQQLTELVAYLRSLASPPATPASASAPAPSAAASAASAPAASPIAPTPAAASSKASMMASATSGSVTAATATRAEPSPGRQLFVSNGCAACHGQDAHGTQFAPSLVGVTKKFPGAQLGYLLHHPNKGMRDGGMPSFNLTDRQTEQITAYLSSLNNPAMPAAAAAPAAPASSPRAAEASAARQQVAALSPEALRGKKIFEVSRCSTCHGVGGVGGTVAAPGLAGTASILPSATLEQLLRHHSRAMQSGGMPLTNFSAADMRALIAYIHAMK